MYTFWLYTLLLIATNHALLVRSKARICPIPRCDRCLDPVLESSPGIGFHLGLTAGTVAVSYDDGRVENIIHVPGSAEYIALMQDFTSHPNRLDLPPLDTLAQRLSYARKELKRRANLLLGRPGTPNAATLSSMLTSLRLETESRLSTAVTTVGIAFANAALASHEEINDALTYAGLAKLDKMQVPNGELNAAYGAFGFGLCSSYKDPHKCEEEENAFEPGDVVLHIDYTAKTLAANTQWISTARSTYTTTKFANWELGRDEAARWAKESDYWGAVKTHIQELATTARRPYDQLLLSGDRAEDEKFLEIVKDALWDTDLASQMDRSKTQINFTFTVARGAAVFQRRRQQGWLDCLQPEYCSQTILERARSKAQHMLEL